MSYFWTDVCIWYDLKSNTGVLYKNVEYEQDLGIKLKRNLYAIKFCYFKNKFTLSSIGYVGKIV